MQMRPSGFTLIELRGNGSVLTFDTN